MPATPSEHKTVQARILAYAQQIGWKFVPQGEAEKRRGFDRTRDTAAEQAAAASPFFDDLLESQVRKLNPKYAEAPGALVAEVTEEFSCHNGKHGTREDVVFLINGIPVLVIECKNATKDAAIALGSIRSAATAGRRRNCSSPRWSSPPPRRSAPPKPEARRGLVWHTQGSGKTFTMIKAAELLFRAAGADKPTVLLLIDRNELEDQMLRNLPSLGLHNVQHADRIATLNKLLQDDYRGIVVSTIHKFQGMPADLNTRPNIFVLIDEAQRRARQPALRSGRGGRPRDAQAARLRGGGGQGVHKAGVRR